jgi:hypothetical protein
MIARAGELTADASVWTKTFFGAPALSAFAAITPADGDVGTGPDGTGGPMDTSGENAGWVGSDGIAADMAAGDTIGETIAPDAVSVAALCGKREGSTGVSGCQPSETRGALVVTLSSESYASIAGTPALSGGELSSLLEAGGAG